MADVVSNFLDEYLSEVLGRAGGIQLCDFFFFFSSKRMRNTFSEACNRFFKIEHAIEGSFFLG